MVHPFSIVLTCSLALAAPGALGAFDFRHHFGDREIGGDAMGQTALADLDGDGDLDFITGQRGGKVWWYEHRSAAEWKRHVLGERSPSDVGGAALDVDRDGRVDFVAGGAWYRNPGEPREKPFTRHVFDPDLAAVHDIVTGDIDGDGRDDVVTMSDRNDLRWYRIAERPEDRWTATRIGDPVHSGISLGDLDRDGDLDVVRSNVWLENREKGRRWVEHRMTGPWGSDAVSWQRNATQTRTADIDGDGRLDVVISDGECRDARIGWVKAPEDPKMGEWELRYLPKGDDAARGAYHSLQVGDFDLDGDLDIFTCEMEHVGGERPPRWFIWENSDGKGAAFIERVVLDRDLGGHVAVAGDVDGDGDLDICSKLWRPARRNGNDGRNHFDYLENLAAPQEKHR